MKVAVLANLKEDAPISPDEPPGRWDDLDDPITIDAILESLKLYGYDAKYYPASLNLVKDLKKYSPDICFNIAEGHQGTSREAQVPALLDMLGIPYTGSGVLPMMLAHNKHIAKGLFRTANLPTPDFVVVYDPQTIPQIDFPFPLFVKPAAEGSSIGINEHAVVYNDEELKNQVQWAYSIAKGPLLIERYIEGREFTISLLGDEILPIVEVVSPAGFYTAALKESDNSGVYRVCPANLPKETENLIHDIAFKAMQTLGLVDLCRLDMRMDRQGNLYILEINPLPLLYPDPEQASFVYASRTAGYHYPEMINKIMVAAFHRLGLKFNIRKHSARIPVRVR